MKMADIHAHNYFSLLSYWYPKLVSAWGKEKYLLKSLYEKSKTKTLKQKSLPRMSK